MPDWKKPVQRRLAELNLNAAAESDLAEELAQHLEDRYNELMRSGTAPEEAHRQVARELEREYPQHRSEARQRLPRHNPAIAGDAGRGNLLEGLWRDLRYSLRSMRKAPVFVAFVVLTLALGIGANTTVFTVLNTLILNPLPARDPVRLAGIAGVETDASKGRTAFPVSYPDLQDYRQQNAVFDSLAGYTAPRPVTYQEGDGSEVKFAELVTDNYFATLGIAPSAGRFFAPGEDTPGSPAVAVLNYATWRTRFGGRPNILGWPVRLNDVVITVIGVAPRGFIGVNAIFGPDFWLPASTAERVWPAQMRNALRERGQAAFLGVARYRPGIGQAPAQANLAAIAADLAREYPATNEGHTVAVRPIRDAILATAGGGTSSQILFGGAALLIVVGIVLLIACSNVANLLLARSAARQHEITVRLAMGASRARLVRQLLTEAVMLGLLGGGAGLAAGYGGLKLVFSALPGGANFATPRFDGLVFAYALALSIATGFLFGTAPALRASRVRLAGALQESGRTMGRSRRGVSLSNALLVGQVAFSFLLLVTAALFLRSIGRAYQMDPGFQTAHLAIFMTNPGQAGYSKAQTTQFYKDVRSRVSAMPGVASVSWASNLPLWGRLVHGVGVEGHEARSKADVVSSILNTVDIHFFETAGIPIERGRDFTEMDRDGSAPVAIVNEKMAHDFWPGGSALGKRIRLPGETAMREIVGIARTANYSALAEPPQACIYVPLEQKYSDAMTLYVRSLRDPDRIMTAVQRQVRAAGPGIMVNDTRTGRALMDNGLFQARVAVILLSVFGMLALALASVGLYGIMAYSVNRRTREIGVRMALGASRSTVLQLILKRGLTLVGAGMGIGFAIALFAGRLLAGALYGVSAADPLSIAGAALLLLAVAYVACYLPALAASRVDPLAALRRE